MFNGLGCPSCSSIGASLHGIAVLIHGPGQAFQLSKHCAGEAPDATQERPEVRHKAPHVVLQEAHARLERLVAASAELEIRSVGGKELRAWCASSKTSARLLGAAASDAPHPDTSPPAASVAAPAAASPSEPTP
eukprot:CAMPEP_0171243366 /NCGR_PEP_ID=MMETSP0790-20130122/46247_1 /TAXON_ID=2925 /ORGANISM="Alexandrium catenella, Strain OF101" /LENGTH=133 /DNA_ID=CAMNT_0011710351 /DNA_START=6 /DNA_END=404 /DNA_ORIENTATION=-